MIVCYKIKYISCLRIKNKFKGGKKMVRVIAVFFGVLIAINIFIIPVFAGCISDCRNEYESEVQSCQIIWGDDPDNDFMYKNCIDDAKSTYESCKDDCTS